MRLARVLLVWACLLPLLPANAAGQYRVTLAAGGSDSAALAKRLAAAYHAQLETPVDENGTFLVTLSAATAELLARDPLVARLEAPAVTPDASTTWDLGTYGYDHAGNIRKIGTRVFVYDTENRLSYETIGTQKQQALTYDGFGNVRTISEGTRLQTVGANEATNRADVASSAANHMSGTYDGAGNMVTAVATTDTAIPRTYTFTYDALNAVTKSTTDASRAYVYNVNDERIGVITLTGPNGTEVESQWTIRDPGGQVLRRFSRKAGQWTWMQDYVYRNGKMLASESNDEIKTLHYHLDHLGSPRLITGNGGAELARHTYYPFGEEVPGPTPPVAEPKKFTGHERDKGGLDYMHARYYDYSMGRFLSVDKATAIPGLPQSWNRYAYVRNNPLNFIDPDGNEPLNIHIRQFLEAFLHSDLSRVNVYGGWFAGTLTRIAGADGITFGQNIFYNRSSFAEYKSRSLEGITLTGHEATHTIQYATQGFFGFLRNYLGDYLANRRAGMSQQDAYRSTGAEQEAYANDAVLRKFLSLNTSILTSIQQGVALTPQQLQIVGSVLAPPPQQPPIVHLPRPGSGGTFRDNFVWGDNLVCYNGACF